MREVECERHQVGRFVNGIAEHHALVAGALLLGSGANHALIDVAALLVNGREHTARCSVELILSLVIANAINHSAGHVHEVDVSLRAHLASNHNLTGCNQCFDSHLRLAVVGEQFVEHSVGNLVSHFVGMTFRHRFGCKQIILHFSNLF